MGVERPGDGALRRSWAQLIKRIYEVDPLVCPLCGSEMKVVGFIIDHAVVGKILRHLRRTEGRGGGDLLGTPGSLRCRDPGGRVLKRRVLVGVCPESGLRGFRGPLPGEMQKVVRGIGAEEDAEVSNEGS